MAQVITFYIGTKEEYQASKEIDPNGIYFVSDERAIYKNNVKYVGEEYTFSSGSKPGTIQVNGKDVAVKGLGSAAYVNTDKFDLAGAANSALSDAKKYTDAALDTAKKYADNKITAIPIATTSVAGLVKPFGEDFDIATDGTLKIYKPIAVNGFSHNNSVQEIGSSLPSSLFSWSFSKTPSSATIVNQSTKQSMSVNAQVGQATMLFNTPLTSTTTFRISATDAHNKTASKDTTIYFYHGKYYGVSEISSAEYIDSAFIQKLTKQLVSGRTGKFSVNAGNGQYIYFAIPSSFGTPVFFVGGFEGGFDLIKTLEYTNPSGGKTTYNVYRSTNASLGSTEVEVK